MSSHHAGALVAHKHPSDPVGAKIAMWMFLFTEVLLFGGLFILYAVYRTKFPEDFHTAAFELNVQLGAFNTLMLLTSSLTVALSIEALKQKKRKLSIWMLSFTIAFGFGFLIVKYFEWTAKIHHGIFPGSETLLGEHSNGEVTFYNLYYAMTGLHGIHVVIGMAVLSVMLYFIARKPINKEAMDIDIVDRIKGKSRLAVVSADGKILGDVADLDDKLERVDIRMTYQAVPEKQNPADIIKLENSGLYWHIVDVIWIFLFPLFYLIT